MKRISIHLLLTFFVATAWGQQRAHVVLAGETLYSIARFYQVPVEDLKTANGLKENTLSVGQRLLIPGTNSGTVQQGGNDTAATGSAEFHVVESKESLFSIARKYGLTADQLRVMNSKTGTALNVGDTLWLSQMVNPSESTETKSFSIGAASQFHVVQKGETLFRISQLYNMPLNDLMKINQLSGNEISVGQKLRVLAPQVLPQAPVEAISRRFGRFETFTWTDRDSLPIVLDVQKMDSVEFFALNPGFNAPAPGDSYAIFVSPVIDEPNPYKLKSPGASGKPFTLATQMDSVRIGQPLTSGILYSGDLLAVGHPYLKLGSVVLLSDPDGSRALFGQVLDRTARDVYTVSKRIFRHFALEASSGDKSGRVKLVFSPLEEQPFTGR